MDPTFRIAAPADLDVLIRFVRGLYAHDDIPLHEPTAHRALDDLIRDPSLGRVWVIERAGRPIGYVVLTFGYSLEYGGRDAFVDELFVDERHRGRGAGTAALRFVAAQCRSVGVRALHLEVDRPNMTAQRLYRREGFEDHDRYLMTRRIAG